MCVQAHLHVPEVITNASRLIVILQLTLLTPLVFLLKGIQKKEDALKILP